MKTKCLFIGMISTLLLLLIHLTVYPYFYARNVGNLTYYVMISVIYIITFFFLLYCLEYLKIASQINFGILSFSLLILFVFWFALMYFHEAESYYFFVEYSLRHRIPFYLYFIVLALCSVFVYFVISVNKMYNLKFLRIFYLIVFSLFQTVVLASPNIINDRGGNLFHIHAYFNPIYNVYKGIPYDEYLSSIYGHYPFFYYIPLKILSLFNISLVHSAMAVTVFFGFVSFIILYLGLNRLIKNNCLFIILVIAVSYISFYYYQSGQYYQMVPHRILFPSITIFIFSLYIYRKIPIWVSVMVSSLALLWNFESGVICLTSITVFMTIQYCFKPKTYENNEIVLENNKSNNDAKNDKRENKCKKREYSLGISIVLVGLSFSLSFVFAFILMNIFNLSMGGKIRSFIDLCYPLLSKNDYELSDISVRIPSAFNIFFIEFALFINVVCYLLIRIIRRKIGYLETVLFSVSILGLGLLPYYINRAAFSNVAIIHIPFVTIFGLFFELYIQGSLNKWKKIYILLVSLLLSFFALGSLSGAPLTYKNRIETSWNMESYYLMCKLMQENIPKDTPAVGSGLPDIYSSLRWDPVIKVMDWSDWNCSKEKKEYALNEIGKQDSILLYNVSGVREELNMDDWITTECFFDIFYYLVKVQGGSTKKADLISYANEFGYTDEEFVDLCILNCYNVHLNIDIMDYYIEMLNEGNDREVLYDSILDDYMTDKFGLFHISPKYIY